MERMRAILVREFGGPDVMQVGEVPTPEPGQGEVLVRIRATGINPVDTYIRAGQHSVRPELPYTPGKDAAGVVEVGASGLVGLAGVRLGRHPFGGCDLVHQWARFQ